MVKFKGKAAKALKSASSAEVYRDGIILTHSQVVKIGDIEKWVSTHTRIECDVPIKVSDYKAVGTDDREVLYITINSPSVLSRGIESIYAALGNYVLEMADGPQEVHMLIVKFADGTKLTVDSSKIISTFASVQVRASVISNREACKVSVDAVMDADGNPLSKW